MRTVDEIKKEMVDEYTSNETVRARYGVRAGEELSLAKASIENILFYVIAHAIWVLERLFGEHKTEVETYISEMKPHSLRWYVNKAKAFRFGQSLIEDTDQYDDTGLTDEAIEDMKIVKYASAVEQSGNLLLKIAKEGSEGKDKLTDQELTSFAAYMHEVKDAGVRIDVRSVDADVLTLDMIIYYDPMVLDSNGCSVSDGSPVVEDAIKNYIQNLPFDGVYSHMALVDALQQVEGIKIAEVESGTVTYGGVSDTPFSAKYQPYSGYMTLNETQNISYEPYV